MAVDSSVSARQDAVEAGLPAVAQLVDRELRRGLALLDLVQVRQAGLGEPRPRRRLLLVDVARVQRDPGALHERRERETLYHQRDHDDRDRQHQDQVPVAAAANRRPWSAGSTGPRPAAPPRAHRPTTRPPAPATTAGARPCAARSPPAGTPTPPAPPPAPPRSRAPAAPTPYPPRSRPAAARARATAGRSTRTPRSPAGTRPSRRPRPAAAGSRRSSAASPGCPG